MDEFEIEDVLECICHGLSEKALGKLGCFSLRSDISEREQNIINALTDIAESVIIFMRVMEDHEILKSKIKGFSVN